MKKFFIIVGLVIIAAAVGLGLSAGSLMKKAIEQAGSKALSTPVSVGAAYLSIFTGKASLSNLAIQNPKGFSDGAVLSLDAIDVEIDSRSLLSDVVRITSITIDAPKIAYEMQGGRDNISALRSTLPRSSGSKTTSSKKLQIDSIFISGGEAQATIAELGAPIHISIPNIHIANPGGKNQAITIEQASLIVISRLMDEIAKSNLQTQVKEQLKGKLTELKGLKEELKKDPAKALDREELKGLKKLF